MAGNYGGNSIPTTVVGGYQLFTGKATTYREYECKTVVASAASGTFAVDGLVYALPTAGMTLDLVIRPGQLTAVPLHAYFLCYKCNGCGPNNFSGDTTPSVYSYSGAAINRPTIIGGDGLRN
jgi:hypothetical protein